MSAVPAKLCESPCETCVKQGLPLLLTRYALMPIEAKAPRLSGNLGAPELKSVPLGKSEHYGLRLLRSGYVYVYDEARKHWDEYFVTADGFLAKVPLRIRALKVQRKPPAEFRCAKEGVAPHASVITIRQPKKATKIWIAFSDVEWTDKVMDLHASAEYRAKHMRCITLSGGKVAPQPGTAPLENIRQHVTEYHLPDQQGVNAFRDWTPHRYNYRHGRDAALLHAAKALAPEGGAAVVALHDPVGLTMEIAGRMAAVQAAFESQESVRKPAFAASVIVGLEASIRSQAELAEILAGEELAKQFEGGISAGHPMGALPIFSRVHAQKMRNHTPESLKRAADQKWQRYTHDGSGKPRFDAAAASQALKTHQAQLKTLNDEKIVPLAKAYLKWMTHQRMVNQMVCNFDTQCVESGTVYTAVVADLMRFVTDKLDLYQLFERWIREGEFKPENFAMRALGLNQDEFIAKLQAADAAPVDGRAFPSDAVGGAVAAYMEQLPASAHAHLAAVMTGLSGPILKYWDAFNGGKVNPKAAAVLAALTGKRILRLSINGTRGQMVQALLEQMYRLDSSLKVQANQVRKAVAAQVRHLQVQGVPINQSHKLFWYILLDHEALVSALKQGANGSLSGQELARQLAQAIRTPQDIEKLDLARGARIAAHAGKLTLTLSGVLMLYNFTKLVEDVEKGMSHEKVEAVSKLAGGVVAISGFVMEQFGVGLEKHGHARLTRGAGAHAIKWGRLLATTGRVLGLGASILVGGGTSTRDGRNTRREIRVAWPWLTSPLVPSVCRLLLSCSALQ